MRGEQARHLAEQCAQAALDNGEGLRWPPGDTSFADFDQVDLSKLIEGVSLYEGNVKLLENIILLEFYFEKGAYTSSIRTERNCLYLLQSNLCQILVPGYEFVEDMSSTSGKVFDRKKARKVVFEEALSLLVTLDRVFSIFDDPDVLANGPLIDWLIRLSSFTDLEDPWTTQRSFTQAESCLKSLTARLRNSLPIFASTMISILQQRIRPLFAKSKNPHVTTQGRKAIDPLPARFESMADEREAKPWRYVEVPIATVLHWTVSQLDTPLIENNWPLLIPPILALVDDSSIFYKVKGCKILSQFLQNVPETFLQRTGIGEVFHDALMSCLLYLPSLAEERESLMLLRYAYPAVFALTRARCPSSQDNEDRLKILDSILRRGIMKGFAYGGEKPQMALLLFEQLRIMVSDMGLAICKHLTHVMPLIFKALTEPFAAFFTPLLSTAVGTLRALMEIVWPRIYEYRVETLRCLILGWYRLDEMEGKGDESRAVQDALLDAMRAMRAILQRRTGQTDIDLSLIENRQ